MTSFRAGVCPRSPVPMNATPGPTMNRPPLLWLIAIGFVAIAVTNIAVLTIVSGTPPGAGRLLRLALTSLLAFFLLRGAPWARYIAFVLALLNCVMSAIATLALLPLAGQMPSWFLVWGFLMGGSYGVLGLLLVLSDEIRFYFRDGGAASP